MIGKLKKKIFSRRRIKKSDKSEKGQYSAINRGESIVENKELPKKTKPSSTASFYKKKNSGIKMGKLQSLSIPVKVEIARCIYEAKSLLEKGKKTGAKKMLKRIKDILKGNKMKLKGYFKKLQEKLEKEIKK